MQDISGFGISVRLVASRTFPAGIELTQFADDADSLDIPATELGDKGMGVNGDLIMWRRPNPLELTLNLIPNSDDDKNMQVLAEANRTARGKSPARDVITLSVMYPDGTYRNYNLGGIMSAILGNALASAGRFKSKPYAFAFENVTGNG